MDSPGELRLFFDPKRGPNATVVFRCDEKFTAVKRIPLDSAATHTLLPHHHAETLGIAEELQPSGKAEGADGTKFKVWSAPRPITAQVVTVLDGRDEPIGPTVSVDVRFAKDRRSISGRRKVKPLLGNDFMNAFGYQHPPGANYVILSWT